MVELMKSNCSLDEILILTDEYEDCHENMSKYEGRLYFKERYKFVYSKMLQSMSGRMKISADLEQFEADSLLTLNASYTCYMGLEVRGYYSHYTSDYEKMCEIARLYAEEYRTAVYIAPHFKEVKPGSLTRVTEHIHILVHEDVESFESFLDRFIEKFVDNEK